MVKLLLIELDCVGDVVDIVRRIKYKDIPLDKTIAKDILFEATFLLALYLGLVYDETGSAEDSEFYHHCIAALDELSSRRDWEKLKSIPVESVEVKDSKGLVALYLEKPHGNL